MIGNINTNTKKERTETAAKNDNRKNLGVIRSGVLDS